MSVDVTACYVVVEEVSEDFAHKNAYYGCKVKKSDSFIREAIAANNLRLGEKYGGGDIDADCPGEDEKANIASALGTDDSHKGDLLAQTDQKECRLRNRDGKSTAG